MTSSTKHVGALVVLALLIVCVSPNASAQNWASTATKAFPVRYLTNATLVGPLADATSMHVVLGLQARNANQIQPTLKLSLIHISKLAANKNTTQQGRASDICFDCMPGGGPATLGCYSASLPSYCMSLKWNFSSTLMRRMLRMKSTSLSAALMGLVRGNRKRTPSIPPGPSIWTSCA